MERERERGRETQPIYLHTLLQVPPHFLVHVLFQSFVNAMSTKREENTERTEEENEKQKKKERKGKKAEKDKQNALKKKNNKDKSKIEKSMLTKMTLHSTDNFILHLPNVLRTMTLLT